MGLRRCSRRGWGGGRAGAVGGARSCAAPAARVHVGAAAAAAAAVLPAWRAGRRFGGEPGGLRQAARARRARRMPTSVQVRAVGAAAGAAGRYGGSALTGGVQALSAGGDLIRVAGSAPRGGASRAGSRVPAAAARDLARSPRRVGRRS